MPSRRLSSLALVSLLALVSCSNDDSADERTVTVFAAASLVDAFTRIGEAFEAENRGTQVEFNFASSSDLATQIIEGAPADVFASADAALIDKIRDASIPTGKSRAFATNSLEIIVEPNNPFGITSLQDLSNPDLVYITCDESVPIGRYSAEILAKANVTVRPKSFEENVKGIVNKVVLGEADAGIVYRTDVSAAGDAALGIPIPPEFDVTVSYPIALLGESPTLAARTFVDFVASSPSARAILESYGFGPP